MTDKRKSKRIKKKVKSEVHSDEGMTFSTTVDISMGGIFISTPEPLDIGSLINISLHLPEKKCIDIRGIVKWVRNNENDEERSGMGIEFIEYDESILEKIQNSYD
jgi:uncharacterized protein (TIGR02266 family)